MSSSMTSANTSIPISKMVNDLFLQWLSLPDTRTTLTSALHSVRTNSKMPDQIPYNTVSFLLKEKYVLDSYSVDLCNTWWWFFQISTFRFTTCFTCTSIAFKSTF